MVRDYLTQVILNLVLNAIDATDDQGRIHLRARIEDGALELSVEDDGRGISLADRCRLFQPFFTTKGSPGRCPGLSCFGPFGAEEKRNAKTSQGGEV